MPRVSTLQVSETIYMFYAIDEGRQEHVHYNGPKLPIRISKIIKRMQKVPKKDLYQC